MPTYDYKCKSGHGHSQVRRLTEPAITTCPDCKKELMRVFSAPLIIFKGNGFYSNDKKYELDINL
jgi:putative FmdB family regulatory protein